MNKNFLLLNEIDKSISYLYNCIPSCNIHKCIELSQKLNKQIQEFFKLYKKEIEDKSYLNLNYLYLSILKLKIILLNNKLNKNLNFNDENINVIKKNGLDKFNEYLEIIDYLLSK